MNARSLRVVRFITGEPGAALAWVALLWMT